MHFRQHAQSPPNLHTPKKQTKKNQLTFIIIIPVQVLITEISENNHLSAAQNIADNGSTRVQAVLQILLKDQEADDLVGWLDPNHYNITHIIILCMHDTIH